MEICADGVLRASIAHFPGRIVDSALSDGGYRQYAGDIRRCNPLLWRERDYQLVQIPEAGLYPVGLISGSGGFPVFHRRHTHVLLEELTESGLVGEM